MILVIAKDTPALAALVTLDRVGRLTMDQAAPRILVLVAHAMPALEELNILVLEARHMMALEARDTPVQVDLHMLVLVALATLVPVGLATRDLEALVKIVRAFAGNSIRSSQSHKV